MNVLENIFDAGMWTFSLPVTNRSCKILDILVPLISSSYDNLCCLFCCSDEECCSHFQDPEDAAGRADREDRGEQEHAKTVAAQEWVCGREDADQLVHIPTVQIFEG